MDNNDNPDKENPFGLGRRYRSRDFRESGANAVEAHINLLLELEKRTRPINGQKSAHGKDIDAIEALHTAGKLVDILAGWALDHTAGLALSGLDPLPILPVSTRNLPEYCAARGERDDHQHEINGGNAYDNLTEKKWTPIAVRQFVINALRGNPGNFPHRVQQGMSEALSALQYGEVLDEVRPANVKLKAKYKEMNLQLRALCFVEYRNSQGVGKLKAQQEIAAAFCVDAETVKSWELRLRKGLGYLKVSSSLQRAKNCASIVQRDRQKLLSGQGNEIEREEYRSMIEWHEGFYGSQALQDAAACYRAHLKSKQSK